MLSPERQHFDATVPMRIAACATAFAIALMACDLPIAPRDVPFGFTRASARAQLQLERRVKSLTDRARIREGHRELTRLPHPAGSPRDRELADWMASEFTAAGMQEVGITTHEVMLPEPLQIAVHMTHPRDWHAAMHEEPTGDRDTHIDPAATGLPHHAYSASGDVEAPVVFAGDGTTREYDWLRGNGIDVRGKIALVRNSKPYSYRGFKAYLAEQHGAAGILMYSDPADAARQDETEEDGRVARSRIERGSIAYDFLVPGDPLTPGWPAVPGARRIPRSAAHALPTIVSIPLSARDAGEILEALEGPSAPEDWHGGLSVPYRVGPGPARLRMTVRMDDAIRPVWTVTGMFRGVELPDEVVIVGNHRDAWTFGGVDPSSGSAALLELARVFGSLAQKGWRPRRSILFASWDAEELAMTSSTEWGEQHEEWLRDRAIAYLNVDSAAAGSKFVAGAAPSLTRLLSQVVQAVQDPVQRVPVGTVARDRARMRGETSSTESDVHVIDDRLGGGSDYVVFLNFLGIPAADLAFDGPNDVYHSIYDTHDYVARRADPGFRYHDALVQIWALAALRLAQADTLPIDPEASAAAIARYVRQAQRRLSGVRGTAALGELEQAAARLVSAAGTFARARALAVDARDTATLTAMNTPLRRFERAFIDPEGLPGRSWYRHLILAPRFTYEPQELPALNEAIASGDFRRIDRAAERLASALRRASSALEGW